MKNINKNIICSGFVVAVLLLLPFESRASNKGEKRKSESISLEELATFGVLGKVATKSSRYSLDMLGITEMECDCTFTLSESEQLWLFHAEPEIKEIDRGGPSHDKLKDGDVIVAVDGMLITTRKAGIRFANLTAGEPVEFTIRRRGRTRSVTVVPRVAVEPEVLTELTLHRSDRTNTVTIEPKVTGLPELARSIEELSMRSAEIGVMIDSIGLAVPLEFSFFPEFKIDFGNMAPLGWIGFGLSFHGNIQNKDEDKPAEWHFKDPPSIKSVQPGSPADEAGLQVNDVLLEIDGLKLDSRKGSKRFSRMEPGQIVEWKVRRGGKTFTVETKAAKRPQRELVEAQPLDPDALQPLRYTGTLDGTEVEVRGSKNVRVEVDEETGEIVIRSVDSVVRLKSKNKR